MERLSYKGGCGVRECTRIEMFKSKRRVWLRVISNKILFKTVVLLKN